MPDEWGDYLSGFHAERPGITEELLERTFDDAGQTPYDWLASAVPGGATVLDLACGSGPLASRLVGGSGTFVGVDSSAEELGLARRRGLSVVQGDATALPLATASCDVVAVSMALMLLPLPESLAEVRRVLRPGGRLVALLPSSRPLPTADALRWGRLLLALRQRRLAYPNDAELDAPLPGFDVGSDERRSFGFEVRTASDARLLLQSLYLPGLDPRRAAAAEEVVGGWVGATVSTPLRLLVATRGTLEP